MKESKKKIFWTPFLIFFYNQKANLCLTLNFKQNIKSANKYFQKKI